MQQQQKHLVVEGRATASLDVDDPGDEARARADARLAGDVGRRLQHRREVSSGDVVRLQDRDVAERRIKIEAESQQSARRRRARRQRDRGQRERARGDRARRGSSARRERDREIATERRTAGVHVDPVPRVREQRDRAATEADHLTVRGGSLDLRSDRADRRVLEVEEHVERRVGDLVDREVDRRRAASDHADLRELQRRDEELVVPHRRLERAVDPGAPRLPAHLRDVAHRTPLVGRAEASGRRRSGRGEVKVVDHVADRDVPDLRLRAVDDRQLQSVRDVALDDALHAEEPAGAERESASRDGRRDVQVEEAGPVAVARAGTREPRRSVRPVEHDRVRAVSPHGHRREDKLLPLNEVRRGRPVDERERGTARSGHESHLRSLPDDRDVLQRRVGEVHRPRADEVARAEEDDVRVKRRGERRRDGRERLRRVASRTRRVVAAVRGGLDVEDVRSGDPAAASAPADRADRRARRVDDVELLVAVVEVQDSVARRWCRGCAFA